MVFTVVAVCGGECTHTPALVLWEKLQPKLFKQYFGNGRWLLDGHHVFAGYREFLSESLLVYQTPQTLAS